MSFLSLYPALLGEAWRALPEPVRRCHDADPTLVALGTFTVTHERGFFARIAIAFAMMPPAGEAIPLRLEVRAEVDHQMWFRWFGDFVMTTRQEMRGANVMIERRGPFELHFRVTVEDGTVVYRPERVRFRVGPISIPLPRWLGPRVEGRAWCEGGSAEMRVRIEIGAPIVGKIVTYSGPLRRE